MAPRKGAKCDICIEADVYLNICKCCLNKRPEVVDNPLLMYVSTYLTRSSRLQLKLATLKYYGAGEVIAAKETLEDSIKELIPESPHYGKRLDSPNRSASEASADDIIDMFKALGDVEDRVRTPVFVATDATKLPPTGPEAAGSLMVVFEALSKQQQQIEQLQETLITVRSDISKNRNDITDIAKKSRKAASQNRQVVREDDAAPDAEPESTPGGAVGQHQERGYAEAVVRPPGIVDSQTAETVNSTFQVVGPNNGRRPNKGNAKNSVTDNEQVAVKKKDPRTGGTAEDAGLLTAGPATFQVVITNVSPSLGTDDIATYVKSKQDGITAVKVEDTSSEGWSTKRFLLTFDYSYHDVIMAQEFWPKKIFFKRWFTRRPRDTTS